jgi:hypothetical protein
MMTILKDHWITGLALLAAAFLVFISIAAFGASDPEYRTEDRIAGVMAGVAALSLVAGLWSLRGGRLGLWISHTMIVLGGVVTAMFFWMLLIPTVIGLTVIYAGVIRRGLQRELRLA